MRLPGVVCPACRFASGAFASGSLCAPISLCQAWAANSSASFSVPTACAWDLTTSFSISLCTLSAFSCSLVDSFTSTRLSAFSCAFYVRSRTSLCTLSEISTKLACSWFAARQISLNLILLCKTSLCTELETERDSVGSIDRVLLPRLDDHSLNTSCVAYFSQWLMRSSNYFLFNWQLTFLEGIPGKTYASESLSKPHEGTKSFTATKYWLNVLQQ